MKFDKNYYRKQRQEIDLSVIKGEVPRPPTKIVRDGEGETKQSMENRKYWYSALDRLSKLR